MLEILNLNLTHPKSTSRREDCPSPILILNPPPHVQVDHFLVWNMTFCRIRHLRMTQHHASNTMLEFLDLSLIHLKSISREENCPSPIIILNNT